MSEKNMGRNNMGKADTDYPDQHYIAHDGAQVARIMACFCARCGRDSIMNGSAKDSDPGLRVNVLCAWLTQNNPDAWRIELGCDRPYCADFIAMAAPQPAAINREVAA